METWDPPEVGCTSNSNHLNGSESSSFSFSQLKRSIKSTFVSDDSNHPPSSSSPCINNSKRRCGISSFRATPVILFSITAILIIAWMKSFDGNIMFSDVEPVLRKSSGKLCAGGLSYTTADGSSSATLSSGSTGNRFSGDKIRTHEGRSKENESWSSKYLYNDKKRYKFPSPNQKIMDGHCDQWAVVTTIHPPSESIIGVSNLKRWCLVIVGDTISPNEAYKQLSEQDNVVYLSSDYQNEHYVGKKLPFIDLLPFKSFARKNIGYLFAISHGAHVIFDFDDDNVLLDLDDGETVPPPYLSFDKDDEVNNEKKRTVLLKFVNTAEEEVAQRKLQSRELGENESCALAFNPYTFMKPALTNSWPRGFPIDCLSHHFDHAPKTKIEVGDLNIHSGVGVLQSLCDGDPDNDAVFRMTRAEATQFTFDRSITSLPLVVPSNAYSPYNAQATTHMHRAFWGLYLPISVPGRVTDIWRAYIAQRLFRDVGLHVLYTPPIVRHERSDHDYLSDFVAEAALYEKTSKLLEYLEDTWQSNALHLPERMHDLWIGLYEHEYIEMEDVVAVKEWLDMLVLIGYEFPEIVEPAKFIGPQMQPNVEGQPYRALPYFDNVGTREKVAVMSKGHPKEFPLGMASYIKHPNNAVLKYVMMTMNEWPLVRSFVLYHGKVLGFSNLYILDSSTNPKCLAFLRYARDALGVNVIFADIDLNKMTEVITDMYRHISGSSDFMIKGDTDEFLFVYDEETKTFTTSVAKYLAGFEENANHPLRLLDADGKIGYIQSTRPEKEICSKDINSPPETFPLGDITIAQGYKAVTLASKPYDTIKARLGGHIDEKLDPTSTNLGMIHAHGRCIEIEVQNCKQVVERHGMISANDTKEEALSKLLANSDCKPGKDFCSTCDWSTFRGVSSHKVKCYAKWLSCEDQMREEYYRMHQNEVHKNENWMDMLSRATKVYGP